MVRVPRSADLFGRISPAADLNEHHPVWEQAYALLRSQILSGQLAPGTRLNLRDVARQLGISVTPTRDAALRLASERLVEGSDTRGLRVTRLTEDDVVHTLDLRLLLETYAVRQGRQQMPEDHVRRLEALLAAEAVLATPSDNPDLRGYAAMSEQFHLALVATASNRVLLDLYQRLHAYVVMERAQHGSFSDQVVLDHSEHVAIVAALRQGNRADAAMLLTAHLDRVRAFTLGMYRAK